MEKIYKIAFHTLGCKLNYSETSAISRTLDSSKFEVVPYKELADIYIINTCAVTGSAEKKCRTLIHAAHRRNPEAHIGLIGCFSELKPEELSIIDGVDIVLGSGNKFSLAQKIESLLFDNQETITEVNPEAHLEFHSSWSSGERTRSFLKIQDGCDYHCSYCTVCIARGESRSDSISHVVVNAREIVSSNIKEIILTGVNIGDFGRKTGESFADLLRELIKIEGLERVRISSIEPNLLTDEIIELVSKSEKLMPHFHIPLQSGSNKILKLMQRRYLREVFATRVSKAKALIPNCFIAADVIVGFPNEQDEDFEETFQFLEQMDLQALHVFSYSIRPNTIAGEMDQQVPEYQKKIRSKRLIELSSKMTLDFYHKQVGKVYPILAESSQHQGNMSGFTPNYIKCSFPYNNNLSNKIIQGQIERIDISTETAIVTIINN
ncbi:MAG: tRNA (N(6)-L-threonylcarbamoyladenosine(37)-C(2))-methylthiotransferase MtaB [Bacteroidota bacterium]